MSGHSKWSTIKREKQATDKARGQIFTKLANAITIAVHEGGTADPESNFKLRLAIEKAHASNMPKANIARAIERASGKGAAGALEEIVYEGFGPGGVAVIVEAITDNKQRTAASLKNTFTSFAGVLGGVGSALYQFEKMGSIHIAKSQTYDQMLALVLEAGGEDLEEGEDRFIIYTKPADLHKVKQILEKSERILESEMTYKPKMFVEIGNQELAQKIVKLLESLEELPDVHRVHSNVDIPKEFLS